jgi:hypothetical protein
MSVARCGWARSVKYELELNFGTNTVPCAVCSQQSLPLLLSLVPKALFGAYIKIICALHDKIFTLVLQLPRTKIPELYDK